MAGAASHEEDTRRGYKFIVELDDDDRSLLTRSAEAEKLSMADIARRAIRQYARRLGVSKTAPGDLP